MARTARTLAGFLVLPLALAGPARAQHAPGSPLPDNGGAPASRLAAEGLLEPLAPEVIARDGAGRVTVRATRVTSPPEIDGRLDDPVYAEVRSFGDFVQQEPHEGQPATARTDVWVLYDDQHVYVAARCWQDASLRMVANDLRRDGPSQFENDNFAVIFDTFRDRRSGFMFQTNPLGALNDQLMTDDGAGSNRDWNTVWNLRTSRDAEGWSVEMAIPFRSLRFVPGPDQVWGVNFRRNLQARTEYSYLSRIPASAGRRGIARTSLAATLVGIETPSTARLLEVKPYVLGGVASDLEADPVRRNDREVRSGIDVKVGLGRSMTADFTAYTDFAQVEEDEAQVNLSRYSLFQPEKREFFLEGLGLFAFGGVPNSRQGGSGGAPIAPVLFFSRRIGLADDDPVQILAGARVTGRLGRWSMGTMQVRQDESTVAGLPRTDFTVLRAKRDLGRRSSVGLIYTRRSPSEAGAGLSQAGGVDLLFAPSQDLSVNAYVAKSSAPGAGGDAASYRARLDYNADLYGLQVEHLVVGDDFTPEVGLMRREDFQRSAAEARLSRRPRSDWLRKWSLVGAVEYGTDNDRRLESRSQSGAVRADLRNGDEASVTVERSYEVLIEPLELTETHLVPVGAYGFTRVRGEYRLGAKHLLSGEVEASLGSFYGGTLREVSYRGRTTLAGRLALEPTLTLNWLELPFEPEPFWVNVVGLRATWSFSPRASVGALVQYSTDESTIGGSVRLRWEYRPGSDLFLVYSEGRDTQQPATPMMNRAFVVKFTRLFRL